MGKEAFGGLADADIINRAVINHFDSGQISSSGYLCISKSTVTSGVFAWRAWSQCYGIFTIYADKFFLDTASATCRAGLGFVVGGRDGLYWIGITVLNGTYRLSYVRITVAGSMSATDMYTTALTGSTVSITTINGNLKGDRVYLELSCGNGFNKTNASVMERKLVLTVKINGTLFRVAYDTDFGSKFDYIGGNNIGPYPALLLINADAVAATVFLYDITLDNSPITEGGL